MIGLAAKVGYRTGGYITPEDSENLKINIPSGCILLGTNITISNESTLISSGNIVKTNYGYNILKNTMITITSTNHPITILKGREILYANNIKSGDNLIFNLPKGARINKIAVEQTGEITIPSSTKILIEY